VKGLAGASLILSRFLNFEKEAVSPIDYLFPPLILKTIPLVMEDASADYQLHLSPILKYFW